MTDPERLPVEPLGRSGVFLRVSQPVPLKSGDVILVGKKLLEFVGPSGRGAACLRLGRRNFSLTRPEAVVGRREGTVVLADDSFLSSRHAGVHCAEGAFCLEDLGSTNGTNLEIRNSVRLGDGDELLCGS